jgi:hypothetical protein
VSVLDWHVEAALEDGWKRLSADEEAFLSFFPRIPRAVAEGWYSKLAPGGSPDHLKVATGFNLERNPPPCWIVTLEEDNSQAQMLGHVLDEPGEDGIDYRGTVVGQSATIHSVAGTKAEVRAMHVAARGIMLLASDWLLDAGYEGLFFEGGGDLLPDEKLLAELQGSFIRTQRWRAIATEEYRLSDIVVRKPWTVAAADIDIDGVQQGAAPTGGT